MTAKYAPADRDGLKPWVTVRREFRRVTEAITYANTAAEARYIAKNRGRYSGRYVTAEARRATPADVARLLGDSAHRAAVSPGRGVTGGEAGPPK